MNISKTKSAFCIRPGDRLLGPPHSWDKEYQGPVRQRVVKSVEYLTQDYVCIRFFDLPCQLVRFDVELIVS